MARAFVIRPFGKKKDSSGKEIDFDRVHAELIDPAFAATDLGGGTTGEIIDSGNIREDMFALILEADLVVCDITVHNANVFYELGIRHALRKGRTVLIRGEPTDDRTPFDLLTDRYLSYAIDEPKSTLDDLTKMIRSSLASTRSTDSPIFQMLPTLSEADPSAVQVVPFDLREDVERARKAGSKGWLRLLADEVRGRRFGWEGAKLVANALWDLRDYVGAKESWEYVRLANPRDVASNLALANIYERLYRNSSLPQDLEASDQAIRRVLSTPVVRRKEKAEALALAGRNEKTRWRQEFADRASVEERQEVAMNRSLIQAYRSYYEAFQQDLNHFYPGLNALQMGTILFGLSEREAWYNAFDSDEKADRFKIKLKDEVSALRAIVPASVDAALQNLDKGNPERVWAELSRADVLFLTTEGRERRIISAYRAAIPLDRPFVWDAARGQLQLFADLGVRAELANTVIADLDERFKDRKNVALDKPVHLVVFAGHRVDDPMRAKARFPASSEGKARRLIREAVAEQRDETSALVGISSAAPGADILFHEVCDELEVDSTIGLPMPADKFAKEVFGSLDNWRTRFLDLSGKCKVLELSGRAGLPRWLDGSGFDPWERGNRWIMKMALTWGAERITLIALWDGRLSGDAPGGTAHMVQLARNAGRVHIQILDAKQLLA